MARPYLEQGKIVMRFPYRDYGATYRIIQYSKVLSLLHVQAEWLKRKRSPPVEQNLSLEHRGLIRAADTTSGILHLLRGRVGTTSVALFSTDDPGWSEPLIRRIARANGIHYIDGVPSAILEEKQKGVVVDGMPLDAHWNARGHKLAGELIGKRLRDLGLLPSSSEAGTSVLSEEQKHI